MAQLTPQDDYMKTALRLPRDLHAQIQEAATESGRSMNAEIVARLNGSFDARQKRRRVNITLTCGPSIQIAELQGLLQQIKDQLGDSITLASISIRFEHDAFPSLLIQAPED